MNPAAVTAVPALPEPHDSGAWLKSLRLFFRIVREQRIAEGCTPAPPLNCPFPHPVFAVNYEHLDARGRPLWNDGLFDAHSDTERLVYRTLQKIGQKRVGRPTRAKGHEIGEHRYHVDCSHAQGARLTGLHPKTWARTVKSLVEKKSIKYALGVARTRGELSETNRAPSAYILEHYSVVLAERKADPNIGADEKGRSWVWGRRNSRKFLSPADREYFRIGSMPADEDLPAAPEERPARPMRVPASVKQKRTLTDLEALMQSVLPTYDEGILRVEKLAKDEARKWGAELSDFELYSIVQGMIEARRSQRHSRPIADAGFFIKPIGEKVRMYLRTRDKQKQDAEKATKVREQSLRETIRELLRSTDEYDRKMLAELRVSSPDVVREVEASMGPAGGGGSG